VYSGLVLYRAAVEAPRYLDGKTMVIIGDKRLRLVAYPISSELQRGESGKSLVNWIGALSIDEKEAPSEDWENLSEQEKLRPRYANWKFDWMSPCPILA